MYTATCHHHCTRMKKGIVLMLYRDKKHQYFSMLKNHMLISKIKLITKPK